MFTSNNESCHIAAPTLYFFSKLAGSQRGDDYVQGQDKLYFIISII